MINTNTLTNGTTTTNTNEGMDVQMVNINVTNVAKIVGVSNEEVVALAIRLGLEVSTSGKKINNVISTAIVVEAVNDLIAKDEVAVTNIVNNNEGMDVKMVNKIKEEIMEMVYSEMNKEIAKQEIRDEYLNRVATVAAIVDESNKKYKRNTLSKVELVDYVVANNIEVNDKELRALYSQLNAARDKEAKSELVHKIIDQMNEGKFTYKMYATANKYKHLLSEDDTITFELALDVALNKASMKNYKNLLAVKRWTKDITVALLRRVVCYTGNQYETEVAPQMFSSLIRACDVTVKDVADSKMTLNGYTTDELLLFSFDKDVLKLTGNNDREVLAKKDYLAKVFYIIAGLSEQKVYIVERKSGIADVYTNINKIKLNEGEVIKQYEFLGITPSGLRSGTMTLAITKEIHADGTVVERDRRVEIMDKASDNSFSINFIVGANENGQAIFKDCESVLDAFKEMSRMMLCATSSKVLGKLDSYVVLDNLSFGAGYNAKDTNSPAKMGEENFVDCQDTTDGLGLISNDMLKENLQAMNIPCSIKDLLGMTFQARGGGLKIAAMSRSKEAIRLEAKASLSRGASVLRAVFKGQEVKAKDLTDEMLDNMQGLFDGNGMKLIDHNAEIELVMLKKAYSSDSKLSDVVNIIMMVNDEQATTALLSSKIKSQILDKLKDIGINVDYNAETDEVISVKCDLKNLKRINNDSQTVEWMFRSLPETMIALAPGVQKTNFNSLLKGLANLINELNVEVNCEYTVVQSDPAVRFGVRIIKEDEVFCPSLIEVNKVSGVRHPVSNLFAVSTFKTLTLKTILKRIDKLNVSLEVKNMLFEFYKGVEGYAIIPASHYYMEKHDGMDFDIDAMQFFLDQEVVAILEKTSDIGTIIDRSIDEEMDCSIKESNDDHAIKAFYKDINKKDFHPIAYDVKVSEEKIAPVKALKGMVMPKKINVASTEDNHYKKNANGRYSLDFSSVAMMVLDYFLNPIDSVGIMATNFYNNAKILMALKSINTEITKEMKQFIVQGMRTMFSCSGLKKYSSPIRKNNDGTKFNYNDRNKVVLCKDVCHKIIKTFINSKGDFADCIQFLIDVCICSRYPAETSIDSAKKMYKVINMFALSGCIKAMGCKNAVKFLNFDPYMLDDQGNSIEEVETTKAFTNIIDIFNAAQPKNALQYSTNNFFGLKLIKEEMSCVGWEDADKAMLAFNTEKKVAGIKDPTYLLKERLMNFANSVIVFAAKELEAFVKSDEANAIRKEFKGFYNSEDNYFRVDKVVSNIVGTYITLTESIKASENDEIDDITAKKYLKTNALQALMNTAKLSFKTARKPVSDEEIGAGVFYYMITSFEKEKDNVCTSVNSKILDIFQKEILAFLKSKGYDMLAAEEILYAVNPVTNRQVKLNTTEGLTCSAYNGHGTIELEDGSIYLLTLKNKKASFDNGTISIVDDKYVVVQQRKTLEENIQSGFYFGAKMEKGIFNKANLLMQDIKKTTGDYNEYKAALAEINPNNILAETQYDEILFRTRREMDERGKSYTANLLIGMKDDQECLIAELYLNTIVAQLLQTAELSESNVRLFMTENSCTVNIIEDSLLAEVESVSTPDTISDSFGLDDLEGFSNSIIDYSCYDVTPVQENYDEKQFVAITTNYDIPQVDMCNDENYLNGLTQ